MDQHKIELRQQLRRRRSQISPAAAVAAGELLLTQLRPLFSQGQIIAVYDAVNGEISLAPLIEYALAGGLTLVRPLASRSSRQLRFESIRDSQAQPIFCEPEYELRHEVKWYNIDLVLLPLLAVDPHGYRLGQGGGYYDATFADRQQQPLLCGVGYDWQLVNDLPREEWDIRLDYFASEERLLKFAE